MYSTTDVVKNAACGSSSCNCGATCACKPGECKC
uniref:Metallothionein n=1 Tax=Ganoderma lucidum TaxID=5315 RepID=A4UU32_GANLU|nr:metallothionein [Ganoderma lucidum]